MSIGIYGAGRYGKVFLEAMRQRGVEADFFIDQYCECRHAYGKPVYRMEEIIEKDADIHVSVALRPSSLDPQSDIVANLRAAGFTRVTGFEASLHAFPAILPLLMEQRILWMRPEAQALVDRQRIDMVRQLLSDAGSRELLDRISTFRERMTPDSYVGPDDQLEYFPENIDLFSGSEALRFVDCGAYTGDTLGMLMDHATNRPPRIDWVVSFEPDARNFSHLLAQIERLQTGHPDTSFRAQPVGVWSVSDTLHLNGNRADSCAFATAEAIDTTAVATVALDDVFLDEAPNYIKMDIEGAEREALLGARRIIEAHQPVLAVCLYHRPADLWEIPLLVHSLNPRYRMYLRTHLHMNLSTVLYCVPENPGK